MKLTFQKLFWSTIAIVLLDIVYVWIREHYGIVGWISPKTLHFWSKDIALLIAWVIFFLGKKKKCP